MNNTTRRLGIAVAVLVLMASCSNRSEAGLTHQYRLDGSYSDDFGGPSLVSAGGALDATRYTFGPNQGLSLTGALSSLTSYSIELLFEFDKLSGYEKILDFKNLSSDTGLYTLDRSLTFYNTVAPAGVDFTTNTDARLVLTRSSSNLVTAYINGVLDFSFLDTSGLAVFSSANVIQFFRDDTVVTGEASGGSVDLIRIYDRDLTASEVYSLGAPVSAVPEPSTLALVFTALPMGLGLAWKRRRKAVTV